MSKPSKPFLSEDFFLDNDAAVRLYHDYAANMPVADYHNHLSPKDIFENRRFNNITEAWLEGDHYKWRAMRINGVEERYCTGNATPKEKFMAWAKTVPATLRNPLYHWTHLELRSYFGISQLLDESSGEEIFRVCNELLQEEDFRVRGLLAKMKVRVVCTTDDPTDGLEYHQHLAAQKGELKMYPTFRPDKAYATSDPTSYNAWVDRLASSAGVTISNFDDLLRALYQRVKFFKSMGCRASDHGVESLHMDPDAHHKAPALFTRIRSGQPLNELEGNTFRCAVMLSLSHMYHQMGWVQQFHLGAMRNNNSRMMKSLGPDTGFDSVGDFSQARHLAQFLDYLDRDNRLARTILYNLNPSDNEVMATMAGNFSDGSIAGKIQFGSGWWFLDQKDGMTRQLNALSNMGLLSQFVGMVTDSRSFLSFPRHEYFRRILCNLLGTEMDRGELPNDLPMIGRMVQHICYYNAVNYFQF